jgi:hypothetical protein
MTDLAALVDRSLSSATRHEFERRVEDQAARLREEIADGAFENEGYTLGLELEAYAVDDDGRLSRVPESVFGPCAKELGLHDVELNTEPEPFTSEGVRAEAAALRDRVAATRSALETVGLELVLDSMWTTPPTEGAREYLASTEDRDGLVVPSNMRPDPRYCAIDRDCVARFGGAIPFSVPGVETSFPSIVFESLATSVQPHVAVPSVEAYPAHYNAAVRTLGPVLALATNSPLLPADLYDDVDPRWLFEHTHHELRIAVFEQSVNCTDPPKVRVPGDLEAATAVPDRLVADPLLAPFLSEWLREDARSDDPESFADTVPELDHKRGTYWRWLRTVAGGQPVPGCCTERSLRIEYRPLPTQPTVTDTVGLQLLVVGLVRGLVLTDHPVLDLPWEAARGSFYAAAREGFDADLAWVTADGERVDDSAAVYPDLFATARAGLDAAGIDTALRERYVAPLRARAEATTAPSDWKLARAREAVADGADLSGAIRAAARAYRERSRATDAEGGSFADWL